MAISQQAIANALGLSRTTVTKILNRDPKYSASELTRDLVFRTAEKAGYDFTSIRRPFKREYGRMEVNTPCHLEIVMNSGEVFDTGTAVARNNGVGGVLLTQIRITRDCLPLRNFTIKVRFPALPALAHLVGECQVARITDASDASEPELGVRFVNASVMDRKVIKDFIDQRAAAKLAARAQILADNTPGLPAAPTTLPPE